MSAAYPVLDSAVYPSDFTQWATDGYNLAATVVYPGKFNLLL